MANNYPNVAVIMAAYNAEATLVAAVRSVLSSTIPVHLYIVDDASLLPAAQSLAEQIGDLPGNVTVLRSEINIGPAGARNMALRRVIENGHKYAAVLDADDLAAPTRFEKQAAFLNNNLNVAAVGTWGNAVHDATLALINTETTPVSTKEVRRALCINSCIINTSVMFKVAALEHVGFWNESMYTAEDYDLFCRLIRFYDLANLPEYLVDFRLSRGGISLTGQRAQRYARLHVQLRNLRYRFTYWQAWAGIAKTLMILAAPTSLIYKMKSFMKGI